MDLPLDLAGFSLEATRPSGEELARLRDIIAPGTPIYLSRVPSESLREQADTVIQVRNAGFEPVAHIAARRLLSAAELADFLSRTTADAGMRRALIIAGDSEQLGPYADALAVIRDGKLGEAGIAEIGIAGYPEPHPKIPSEALAQAMRDKMAAANGAGLALHIVSQFTFAPDALLGWLARLRADGIDAPVKAGMAGPTKLTSLLRYAARCGVKASAQGMMSGAAATLMGNAAQGRMGPDRIVEALRQAGPDIGAVTPHYFSFGGLADTARYAASVARGTGQRAIKRAN